MSDLFRHISRMLAKSAQSPSAMRFQLRKIRTEQDMQMFSEIRHHSMRPPDEAATLNVVEAEERKQGFASEAANPCFKSNEIFGRDNMNQDGFAGGVGSWVFLAAGW